MRTKIALTNIALTSAAALLALAGCSAGDNSTSPSAPPSSPAAATGTPAQASDGPSAEVLSLAEACRMVAANQEAALGTLSAYLKNPLNGPVTVRELDQLRSELHAYELSVPAELRPLLNRQVGVLNSAVQGIQDGNVQNVDVSDFQAAAQDILDTCQGESS